MLIKSVKNTSETNKLTVSIDNNSENSASIVLLPNESVSNNVQTDLWSKLSMNSADFTKVVVAGTNGWRIQYQYYAYAFDKAVDKYNVLIKTLSLKVALKTILKPQAILLSQVMAVDICNFTCRHLC